MADNLLKTRQACAEALRRCELAERQAQQLQEAAAHQRKKLLNDAKQTHDRLRQQTQAHLQETRGLAQASDRILSDLGLMPVPPTPAILPSGAGLDELARALQNQRVQARNALQQLRTTTASLREERSKWWKFW